MNIAFVTCMILFPVSCAVTSYLSAKQKKIEGSEPYSVEVKGVTAIFELIKWFVVGVKLFQS